MSLGRAIVMLGITPEVFLEPGPGAIEFGRILKDRPRCFLTGPDNAPAREQIWREITAIKDQDWRKRVIKLWERLDERFFPIREFSAAWTCDSAHREDECFKMAGRYCNVQEERGFKDALDGFISHRPLVDADNNPPPRFIRDEIVNDDNLLERWSDHTATVEMNSEEWLDFVRPVARISRKLKIIDPYFLDPYNIDSTQFDNNIRLVSKLIEELGVDCPSSKISISIDALEDCRRNRRAGQTFDLPATDLMFETVRLKIRDEIILALKRRGSSMLREGRVTIRYWNRNRKSASSSRLDFHDRFLLFDRMGIKIGSGLQERDRIGGIVLGGLRAPDFKDHWNAVEENGDGYAGCEKRYNRTFIIPVSNSTP